MKRGRIRACVRVYVLQNQIIYFWNMLYFPKQHSSSYINTEKREQKIGPIHHYFIFIWYSDQLIDRDFGNRKKTNSSTRKFILIHIRILLLPKNATDQYLDEIKLTLARKETKAHKTKTIVIWLFKSSLRPLIPNNQTDE